MTDIVPDQRNPFAVIVGKVLHPYILPIPTVLAILNGLPLDQVLKWTLIVIAIVLLPGMTYAAFLEYRGQLLYKRSTRGPLYLVGWLSVLVCLGVVLHFDAPLPLVACVATLAIWLPLQWAINHWITKVSAHAAVATGCFVAIVLLGKAETPSAVVVLLILVVITLWARVVTHHHTIHQVLLGVLVGALPVLVVFPLVLG